LVAALAALILFFLRQREEMSIRDDDEFARMCESVARKQRKVPGPQRIADVVSRLMARTGYAHVETSNEWQAAVQQAVGKGMAKHCRAGRLRRGVLEITVRNSSVLQELSFRKKALLIQLNGQVPDANVSDLRFRVGDLD
jgi:hypothetical protein